MVQKKRSTSDMILNTITLILVFLSVVAAIIFTLIFFFPRSVINPFPPPAGVRVGLMIPVGENLNSNNQGLGEERKLGQIDLHDTYVASPGIDVTPSIVATLGESRPTPVNRMESPTSTPTFNREVAPSFTPTPSISPSETLRLTLTSSPTQQLPTSTSTSTTIAAPTQTAVPSTSNWHEPTNHEHGDPPPAWVVSSGLQPDYNAGERHEGYKSTLITAAGSRGWVGSQKALFLVFHAFSFPPAFRARYHSYQLWVLHSDNTVSWMQGSVDAGSFPDHRVDKCTEDRNKPDMRIPFLGSGCISDETWYPFGRGIHPDLVRSMDGGYYFDPEDNLEDPSTWDETGRLGLTRLDTVIIRPIADGLEQGIHCAHRNKGIVGPCGGEYITQNISPRMFDDCANFLGLCEVRGEVKNTFHGQAIELPN